MNIFVELGWESIWNDFVAAGRLHSLHLFQNNYVPVLSDVVGNYTEATFSGYASQNPTWGAAFINGSTQAEIDAGALTFTRSAGASSNTIYGIYVLDSGGVLTYAERFPAPVSMATAGDAIVYTPKATLINQ
jgi:hypothetical protein